MIRNWVVLQLGISLLLLGGSACGPAGGTGAGGNSNAGSGSNGGTTNGGSHSFGGSGGTDAPGGTGGTGGVFVEPEFVASVPCWPDILPDAEYVYYVCEDPPDDYSGGARKWSLYRRALENGGTPEALASSDSPISSIFQDGTHHYLYKARTFSDGPYPSTWSNDIMRVPYAGGELVKFASTLTTNQRPSVILQDDTYVLVRQNFENNGTHLQLYDKASGAGKNLFMGEGAAVPWRDDSYVYYLASGGNYRVPLTGGESELLFEVATDCYFRRYQDTGELLGFCRKNGGTDRDVLLYSTTGERTILREGLANPQLLDLFDGVAYWLEGDQLVGMRRDGSVESEPVNIGYYMGIQSGHLYYYEEPKIFRLPLPGY